MVTRCTSWAYVAAVLLLTIVSTATAKYSGGTGEPNDPYQIATAADLIALGETPADYDKHFILTADVDLDPNLPGGKVFDKAVIAPETTDANGFHGTPFTGRFDGNGHTISHLTIRGGSYLGLFGRLALGGLVRSIGAVDVDIGGSGDGIGGLVGLNGGTVAQCHCTGAIKGNQYIGGLVGSNSCAVSQCYSISSVGGDFYVGGLVGINHNTVSECYSSGTVTGWNEVGGLVGWNCSGHLTFSYTTSAVNGTGSQIGGLVGDGPESYVTGCFWDTQTSGRARSDGGTAKGTAEMQTAATFIEWARCGTEGAWTIDEGNDYPRLWWENRPGQVIAFPRLAQLLTGAGTQGDPFLIRTAEQLDIISLFPCELDKHFRLVADIDLDPNLPGRRVFNKAVIPTFSGSFDGGNHTISHLTIRGGSGLGLFDSASEIRDVNLVDVDVVGSGSYVGGLAGSGSNITNCRTSGSVSGTWAVGGLLGSSFAIVTQCCSTGAVSGSCGCTGGLVGENYGSVVRCRSDAEVDGVCDVGGLVGENADGDVSWCCSTGTVSGMCNVGGLVGYNEVSLVSECYSASRVDGNDCVGGLVGMNTGAVIDCYAKGGASGVSKVGGLVGVNDMERLMTGVSAGYLSRCYSVGLVIGDVNIGGLVGYNSCGTEGMDHGHIVCAEVTGCFWDTQTAGQATSAGGTGKTTAEMQTAQTFLDVGWDFVGETANGPNDVWKIAEGLDYPRLWWEPDDGRVTVVLGQVFTVTLESNPSTGYRWEWVDHQDSIVEQMGQAQFKPRETGDPPLVGAGGWESFDFKAVGQGQMTLKLVYRRPWEEGVEPLKTFSLQVTVP